MGWSFLLGGLRITAGSTGSTPSDWLGGPEFAFSFITMDSESEDAPSIRMLINRICIAFRGLLRPKNVLSVISVNAAMAVLSWKDRKF